MENNRLMSENSLKSCHIFISTFWKSSKDDFQLINQNSIIWFMPGKLGERTLPKCDVIIQLITDAFLATFEWGVEFSGETIVINVMEIFFSTNSKFSGNFHNFSLPNPKT